MAGCWQNDSEYLVLIRSESRLFQNLSHGQIFSFLFVFVPVMLY